MTILGFWVMFFSCSSESTMIRGTTARISAPIPIEDSKRELKIYHNRLECEDLVAFTEQYNEFATAEEAIERCLPWVNRSTGEVHLGFSRFHLG